MGSTLDAFKSLLTFRPEQIGQKSVTVIPSGIPGDIFSPLGQRDADWSGVSMGPSLSRSYRLCATAYACSTFLADAVAEAPLRVYRIDQGQLVEQPEHRLRKLLASPNPMLSESELMGMLVMTMGMFGYGIIEKVRSSGGIVVELWPLRPDWLVWEQRSDGGSQWVYRKPRHDPRVIKGDDLIFIPYRHDESQTRIGVSPLQIVAREIGIDVALTDLLKVFIDAGGIPPWAVEFGGDVIPEQHEVDTFRALWSNKYGGVNAYQQIGILYGGMKLVKVGDSIGDMAWPDLRGLVEMKIAQAFRVPAELIQARDSMSSGSLTTTEMDGATGALQAFGATPLRARIDGAFTRGLLPEFVGADPSYTIEFDTSDILSLQEDRNALHDRVRADFDAGLLTLNQALQETGRPEIGAMGDVYKSSFTTIFVPARDLTGTVEATIEQPPKATIREIASKRREYVDRKNMPEIEAKRRASYLQTSLRNRQKLTEIGTRKMRTFFREQGERVVDAMTPKGADDVQTKAHQFNWSQEDDLLRELMNKYYDASGKAAFGQVAAFTDTPISWDLANPNVRRVMTELGHRIVGINNTTQADVQRIVTQGLNDGLAFPDIGKNLKGLFEETYKNRAETIARTESAYSYSTASLLGYEESGVVDDVEMVDNLDHTEDYGASDGLTCAQRDGMRVSLADAQLSVDAEHPNGSLSLIPILSTPLGGE